MVIKELKNIKSGKKELRQFGLILSFFLFFLTILFSLRDKTFRFSFFILSIIAFFLGLYAPVLLKPIQRALMSFATVVGWIVTRIILTILFYLVLAPIGILGKIFGYKFLDTVIKKDSESYWIVKDRRKLDKKSYEKQF